MERETSVKFSEFDFHPSIMAGIEKNKYTECTPVQEAALEHIMEGRDLSGLAQTGTAFCDKGGHRISTA